MIILLCDLVYKNIRLYVEFVKEVMVRYVGYLWEHREDEGDKVLT